ncbi:MAG: sugar phosphate isomerase/epimerase [Clostridia bacterium]|nr:sugar phosphate isomerase/epimerase [Clostridia bacterium]
MAKPILSAFADEYSAELDVQLKMLQENGIGYIELRGIDGKNISTLTDGEVQILKEKLEAAQIKVSAIGSPIGKIALDGDFEAHLEMARRVFKTAVAVGTTNIRMFSFYPPEGKKIEDCFDEVVEKLDRLLTLAEEYGLTLCHENEAGIFGESPEACHRLLTAFGGRLKCVFDMGNFTLENYKAFPEGYELLRDYIVYFHIKDGFSTGEIVPPTKGQACIPEILAVHNEIATEDYIITLEPHLEIFDGLSGLVKEITHKNPYQFPSAEVAFQTAIDLIKEVIA